MHSKSFSAMHANVGKYTTDVVGLHVPLGESLMIKIGSVSVGTLTSRTWGVGCQRLGRRNFGRTDVGCPAWRTSTG